MQVQQSDEYSESDSEHSQNKIKNKNKRVPIVERLKDTKHKSKKAIYINLSLTQYDVITEIAQELGWVIQNNSQKGDWDVLWTDSAVDPQVLIRMHYFQKISHFPGIHVLARKNLLGQSLMQMKQKFQQYYNFFPKTWLLPSQYPQLRSDFEGDKTYIVKPQAQCQGKGIFLAKDLKQVENGNHYVVQQYLSKPYLIEGLKFDFRVYVLLCGTNPMRLYIYEEGLARLATQKYVQPNQYNIKKQYMHLTNYAINKKNPKYIYNKSSNNMGYGHKRSLTSVLQTMERKGVNIKELKQKIYDIIIKTFIVGLPLVSHQYKFCQPYDQYRNMCFHILGLDIMLDENANPYILEVNHTPSFTTDTPLDYRIKSSLIKDTLILMNINTKTKVQLVGKAQQKTTGKRQFYENQQRKLLIKKAQQQRDQYQDKHLGSYTKIYPVKNQSLMQLYDRFINEAETNYFSENNVLRAQMEMESEGISLRSTSPKKISVKISSTKIPPNSQRGHSGSIIGNGFRSRQTNSTIKSFNSSKIQVQKSSIIPLKIPSSNYVKINLRKQLPKLQSQKNIQTKQDHNNDVSKFIMMKNCQNLQKSENFTPKVVYSNLQIKKLQKTHSCID